jgi:hypothetical protein
MWKAYLASFIFGSGTAMGAVAFAAALELTGAEWAGPLRPMAERFRAFLPVSFVLYGVLLLGAPTIYPWMRQPSHSAWLQFGPFVWRDLGVLLGIYGAAVWFSRASARARGSNVERSTSSGSPRARPRGDAAPATPAAVSFLIVYAAGFGILSVDLLMSLEPSWSSTLFPAYFATASLYAGIAAIVVAAAWTRPARELMLNDARSRDLGNLFLGFALLWMYLVWSQYLVLWYGNVTEDVGYVIHRFEGGWRTIVWMVIAARFIVPFLGFLTRAGKHPRPVTIIGAVSLAGFWLECYLLVAPSR